MRQGVGYLGVESYQFSISGENIIPDPPAHWTQKYNLYKFSFLNPDSDVSVLINNDPVPKLIPTGIGFNVERHDPPIFSFKIVEDGVKYFWFGAY